jgi:hypothetical protein
MPFQDYKNTVIPISSYFPLMNSYTLQPFRDPLMHPIILLNVQIINLWNFLERQSYAISIHILYKIIIFQEYIFFVAVDIFILIEGGGVSFEFALHNVTRKSIAWLLPLNSVIDPLHLASQKLSAGKFRHKKSRNGFQCAWARVRVRACVWYHSCKVSNS